MQVCFHVSARRSHRVPEGYAECFGLLGANGVLDPDLARSLQRMARFRNMLIHVYWDVDYDKVYDILQENLGDLRRFMKAIGSVLP